MGYFNYHAKIKKLISENKLLGYELLIKYNGISPCILFIFIDHPPMPIREYRFSEYKEVLESYPCLKDEFLSLK